MDPVLGFSAPELGWVPTPSAVMRRGVILDALKGHTPGRLIEFGCGSGALLHDLAALGFHGKGIDSSDYALRFAQRFWSAEGQRFRIEKAIDAADREAYDYLAAFEVLEHVPDDAQVLRSWLECLRGGGKLFISVPAHRRQWGAADEWAGHQRRYDREDVVRLVEGAGCRLIALRSYGFPLLNLLQPLSNYSGRKKLRAKSGAGSADKQDATARSGVDRSAERRVFGLYSNPAAKLMFRIALAGQRRFANSGMGTGFLVVAEKP
jgi:SAM-dependent methyltransferase